MKNFFAVLLFSVSVQANTYTVKVPNANVYDGPEGAAKIVGQIPKGRKVFSSGGENGFLQVTTKSGRAMWLKQSDLEELSDVSDDLANEHKGSNGDSGMHLTWDLGASAGSYRGFNYTEVQLGVNWYFVDWLAWRNAAFGRFINPKNIYGLDSSARLVFSPSFMDFLGVTLFGGPGYRFVTEGNSVPFAEGGLVLHVGGFSLGGGVKTLFHSFSDQNLPDDTQYFIILSGSGTIF